MKKLVLGILAHVDAGKTTLSEALLYTCGSIRKLGRVDHRNTALDTHKIERERGITVFSKQAQLRTDNMELCLLDTPGHADLTAETERTLDVIDYALLVISGTDGVQAHTETLWRLLERHNGADDHFRNENGSYGQRQTADTLRPARAAFGGLLRPFGHFAGDSRGYSHVR